VEGSWGGKKNTRRHVQGKKGEKGAQEGKYEYQRRWEEQSFLQKEGGEPPNLKGKRMRLPRGTKKKPVRIAFAQ